MHKKTQTKTSKLPNIFLIESRRLPETIEDLNTSISVDRLLTVQSQSHFIVISKDLR